jgi:hypothetical protein
VDGHREAAGVSHAAPVEGAWQGEGAGLTIIGLPASRGYTPSAHHLNSQQQCVHGVAGCSLSCPSSTPTPPSSSPAHVQVRFELTATFGADATAELIPCRC